MNTKEDFELEFERLKKETHNKFNELFERYKNVKDWKIKFNYEWSVPCTSWIDQDDDGWYEKLVKDKIKSEGCGKREYIPTNNGKGRTTAICGCKNGWLCKECVLKQDGEKK